MKISGIRSSIVALPADEPLADAAENPNGTRPIVTLHVETDDGVVGVGVTYFGGALTGTLRHAVDELGALMVGEDPLRTEAIAAKLRAAAGSAGPAGIFNLAHSALDQIEQNTERVLGFEGTSLLHEGHFGVEASLHLADHVAANLT